MSDIETRDTEPLGPVEPDYRKLDKARARVFLAALIVGRHWNDQDGVNAQYIDALADAVAAFDALQPKG